MGPGRELTIIGGLHDVRLALKNQPRDIVEVLVDVRRRDRRIGEVVDLAARQGVQVSRIARRDLDDRAAGLRHQGVLARCRGTRPLTGAGLESFLANLDRDPLLLVLDGVQDPHNLGALMRTADAAGVDAVVVPEDRSCKITPVVSRVAAGAVHSVPFFAVPNLGRTLAMVAERGIWITGAAGDCESSLWDCDLSGPAALVVGAEGGGLRELTRRHCDRIVRIPMLGEVESLNVSVAAGILLYEAVRQRLGAAPGPTPAAG